VFTESRHAIDDMVFLLLPAFISVNRKGGLLLPRGVTGLPRWAKHKARAGVRCQAGCIDIEDKFDDVDRRNQMQCRIFPRRDETVSRQTRSGVYRRRNNKEVINLDIEEAAMGARESGPHSH
jgi:hypothetical protein